MNSIRLFLAAFVAIFIAACGGGGGGGASAPIVPPAPTTFTISGTITPANGVPVAAASGVTVSLSGASSVVATTNANGAYSFANLSNGSYTVKPTSTTNTFNPISNTVLVSGANATQNFTVLTAAPGTFTIGGAVSGAVTSGATITLSGAANGSATSGTNGAYNFGGLATGSYTLIPSLTGYSFAPASSVIASLTASSPNNNFVATLIPVAHTLSGSVGTNLSGVTVLATGPATVSGVSDTSGNYGLSLYDGTYTVSPSKTGYTFQPSSTSVTMAGAAKTQNFAGTANSAVQAAATGSVTGSWFENVLITLSGGSTATTTTNSSGSYSFPGLASGQSYTFTPTLPGYAFTPASSSVSVIAGSSAPVAAPTFAAAPVTASYTISGTVNYAGTKTGGIRVQAYPCNGCSAAAGSVTTLANGNYTIRGLQTGTYGVVAEMDAQGTGQDNASNPISPPATVSIGNANVSGIAVTLTDPTAPTAVAPTVFKIRPSNGAAFVDYQAPTNISGQEIATGYQLTWGTTNTATGSGSASIPAQGANNSFYMLSLPNGIYYFQLTAKVGTTSSAPSAVIGPITIGNSTAGTFTVSGAVTFSGTATGPMVVLLHTAGGAYFTRIASPASPQAYSVVGVPAGTYQLYSLIDMNNNNIVDAGDISNIVSSNPPPITISVSTSGNNLTLSSANATASIGTDHQFDGTTNNYQVNTQVNDGVKRVVSATLFSGPNTPLPLDMAISYGSLSSYNFIGTTVPGVGDNYQFKVTYSDGTSGFLSGSVTAVLNSFANSLAVAGGTSTTPTFSWTAPTVGVPAAYLYSLNVYPTGGGGGWYYPSNSNGMPSSQLSVSYNADGTAPLLGATGTCMGTTGTCTWQVQVRDATGSSNNPNTATRLSTFTH